MIDRARAFTARGGRERPVATDFSAAEKFDTLPQSHQAPGVTAFLSIQEGCDKFCTYCVVPYTRGAEYSRPVPAVLTEARRLAAQGVRVAFFDVDGVLAGQVRVRSYALDQPSAMRASFVQS